MQKDKYTKQLFFKGSVLDIFRILQHGHDLLRRILIQSRNKRVKSGRISCNLL